MKEIAIRDDSKANFYDSRDAREVEILYNFSKSASSSLSHVVGFKDFFFINGCDRVFYLVLELCDVLKFGYIILLKFTLSK